MRTRSPNVASCDASDMIRRHAAWRAPLIALMNGIFIQGLVPGHFALHAVLVIVAFCAGLVFRRVRRASMVIGGNVAMNGLSTVYLFGIVAPLSYLSHAGYALSLAWTAPSVVVGLGAFLLWRTRVSLLKEWSRPLEQCSGVHVGSEGTIVYESVVRKQPIAVAVACVLLAVFVPALYFSRHTSAYLPLAIVVGPACIALLATDSLAYSIAFYISIRRWERAHSLPLCFLPLRAR